MLGYTLENVIEMIYAVKTVRSKIDAGQAFAIHSYLGNTVDLLEGLIAEGHVQ